MTDPPPTIESLLDKVVESTRDVVQYMRRRFLGTWLALCLLAILTCLALLIATRSATTNIEQTDDIARLASHNARQAEAGNHTVVAFLQGTQGIPGVPGADGKDGSPGQPGAPGSALANQSAATAAAVSADGGDPTPGPAGPAGPMGAAGPLGPIGSTGNSGANGQPGAQGAQGDAGPAGEEGNQGDTGDPGEPGNPGAPGPTGPAGATGEQGPPGAAGADGAQGQPGPAGATGATGPPGPSGVAATQVVTATSPMNPGNTKTVIAMCPAATVLLGGGFTIDPQTTQLELQGSSPVGTGWTVTVSEEGLAVNVDWSVTAYVVCSVA